MPSPTVPKITCLGQAIILLFILGCAVGAGYFFFYSKSSPTSPSSSSSPLDSILPSGKTVEVGIAYGTEKKRWLEWAVQEFAKTKDGRSIKINLIPMGSLEGAQAILAGDKRIQVWSPASALFKDVFVQEWQIQHNKSNPMLREEPLALSPMVFVFWSERYDAFVGKYGSVDFNSIRLGLAEKNGWEGIAGKPEWGFFKFGHTHPNESNSGLMTLVLMAYESAKKTKGLTLKDILAPATQDQINEIERGISGFSNSTGNMMREMILKGPASYDGLFVYENVVIDYLKNAEGRWGELRVAYPKYNMWSDHPYYIIDAPWSSDEQRKAAGVFLDFLLSEPIQKQSLVHGFRPGNPAVSIKLPDSPFVLYSKSGLKIDVNQTCEAPTAEVINNLLTGWQRNHGAR